MKRNVSGLCDCGDPEAWDPDHFCSDHKGGYVEPEKILSRLPKPIREGAVTVFEKVCIDLKKNCLMLLNLDESAKTLGLNKDEAKKALIDQQGLIYEFLGTRMAEVTAFVHIIAELLFDAFLDKGMYKNKGHTKCCMRCFPKPE